MVDKKRPRCLDTLKVAIREAVAEMPLDMVQRATMDFYKRVCLCIEAEGGVFKHKKFFGDVPLVQFEINNFGEGDSGGESEDEENGSE